MQPTSRFSGAAVAAVFCALFAGCGGSDNAAPMVGTTLTTLSNRADLVSGGDVLVEVKLVSPASFAKLRVERNGTDVTLSFAKQPDGRIIGTVTGLVNGTNTIVATASDRSFAGARLIVTNHPVGGPVLLGSQVLPFVCATPTPIAQAGDTPGSNASGLSTAAVDAQCNIATETRLYYRTLAPVSLATGDGGCAFIRPDPLPTAAAPNPATPANSCLQPYDPASVPTSKVASTTTTDNVTAPYIVRVERGTINRGIYDISVLYDPGKPWTPTAPQPQWNRKVVHQFGGGNGQPRRQYRSSQNWASDMLLARGYLVSDSSLTDSVYNSNQTLGAETLMMVKEHIADSYGEIAFTMGAGCSGGAILQNSAVAQYPGLLDGTQVQCDFPDEWTPNLETTDCVLLVNAYVRPEWQALTTGLTQAQVNAKKAAVNGHLDQRGCQSWFAFGAIQEPGNYTPTVITDQNTGAIGLGSASTNLCELPAALVYDPITNPGGTRCEAIGYSSNVLGTTAGPVAGSMRGLRFLDNVGVQYGLKALQAGAITAEEFVVLNETVGGFNADGQRIATRTQADAAALPIMYRSGLIGSGKQLGAVPTIDMRGWDEQGLHHFWFSYAQRDRIDAESGSSGHANQVLWRYGNGLLAPAALQLSSLQAMDAWLTALQTSAPRTAVNAARTQAQIIAARPAPAADFCYLSADTAFTTRIFDAAVCNADARLIPRASPRQVSGGPRMENVLKCQLKPWSATDYGNATFTTAQQARLMNTFATGVCDWSKPGVGQQPAAVPLNYQSGPGGQPLGPPPESTPI